jgi:hypothetical protein
VNAQPAGWARAPDAIASGGVPTISSQLDQNGGHGARAPLPTNQESNVIYGFSAASVGDRTDAVKNFALNSFLETSDFDA